MIVKAVPIIVNSWQLDSKVSLRNLPMWLFDIILSDQIKVYPGGVWKIPTAFGELTAKDGDYLVVGINDSISVCSEDVFKGMYEAIV